MFAPKYCYFLCFFIIVALIIPRPIFAQQIELKDVAHIQLIERWGGASSDQQHFVVINQNNVWKCYRTKLVKGWDPKIKGERLDSSRVFIKEIPVNLLTSLLSALTKPDTGIVDAHFKLSNDSLIKYTDTVHPKLTRKQKTEFVSALKSSNNIHEALVYRSPIFKNADSGRYAINVITNDNKNYVFIAQKNWFVAYPPWQYDGGINYNPDILKSFFEITGNYKEAAGLLKMEYIDIDKYVYRKYFETRFNWELFRAENPELYRLLNNTITPYKYIVDRHKPNQAPDFRQRYYFKSSRLPSYVYVDWSFHEPTAANIRQFKRYEDTLAGIFSKGNFLFRYLKSRKGAKLFIVKGNINGMQTEKKYVRNKLRSYYPPAATYDINHLHFLRVLEADGNLSHWLLFAGKAIILAGYTGEINNDFKVRFTGITPDPNAAGPHKKLQSRCLIFDSSGQYLWGSTDRVFMLAPF